MNNLEQLYDQIDRLRNALKLLVEEIDDPSRQFWPGDGSGMFLSISNPAQKAARDALKEEDGL